MESDEKLMERVRQGELRQLAELFRRYHRPLYKYCLAIGGNPSVAEDGVQEAFRRILQYRESYRGGLFRVWLYRIARNAAMDLLPGQPRDYPEADPVDESPGPERRAMDGQSTAALRAALMRLRPAYREVLALARFQELSSREIGQVVGAEEGAVRVRLYRALKALAAEFQLLNETKDGDRERQTA